MRASTRVEKSMAIDIGHKKLNRLANCAQSVSNHFGNECLLTRMYTLKQSKNQKPNQRWADSKRKQMGGCGRVLRWASILYARYNLWWRCLGAVLSPLYAKEEVDIDDPIPVYVWSQHRSALTSRSFRPCHRIQLQLVPDSNLILSMALDMIRASHLFAPETSRSRMLGDCESPTSPSHGVSIDFQIKFHIVLPYYTKALHSTYLRSS